MKFDKKPIFIEKKSSVLTLIINFSSHPLKSFLFALILLTTAAKFTLIGNGFLAFPDEFRYTVSENALYELSQLKFKAAVKAIFSTQGRPFDTVVKMLPSAVQHICAKIFHLSDMDREISYPVFIYNFLIYCLIIIVHWRFSKLILKNEILALISVLLYSSLTNSHIYLRHAFPYDLSLLIFYFALYKSVSLSEKNGHTVKQSISLGFIAFLGYLAYPGYFILYCIGLLLLFFNKLNKANFLSKILLCSTYVLGSLLCLALFEALSRFAGLTYIGESILISSLIIQGSFEESFEFLFKYLFEVEFIAGLIIVAGLIIYSILMIYHLKKRTFKKHSLMFLLGFIVIGNYIAYAFAGYYFHKMVFYGRLLHQYLPIICIICVFSIAEFLFLINKKNQLFSWVFAILMLINFGVNFYEYTSFSYPQEISMELSKIGVTNEIESVYEYENSLPLLASKNNPKKKALNNQYQKILVVNCSYLYPINDLSKFHPYQPNNDYTLLVSKPHFLNFKAYQYEGFTIAERQNLDKMNLQIQVYSK